MENQQPSLPTFDPKAHTHNGIDSPLVDKVANGINGGGGSPGGANKDIQFNDSGSFGGTNKLQWNEDDGSGTTNITIQSFDDANSLLVGFANGAGDEPAVIGSTSSSRMFIGRADDGQDGVTVGELRIQNANGSQNGGNGGKIVAGAGDGFPGQGGDLNLFTGGGYSKDSGSNLVTNGSFTGSASGWTLGTGWAYGSNNVLHTAGHTNTLFQNIAVLDGVDYHVSFQTTGTVGSVVVTLGDNPSDSVTIGASISANFALSAGVTSVGNIVFTPTSNFDGTIDNVSVHTTIQGSHAGNMDISTSSSDFGIGGRIDVYTNGGANGEGSGIEMLMQPGSNPTLSFYGGDFIADGLGGITVTVGSPLSSKTDNVTPGDLELNGGDSSSIPNGTGGGVTINTGASGSSSGAAGDLKINLGTGVTRNGRLNIQNLPTSSAGLSSGDIWIDTTGGLNILKIV